ncbi:MAG: hypothetical protein L3J07_03545 [Candidatus Magasanikbacteria bacterium]|nr:hypothetical protein [Candidatus Magasanikbacteria bacterium]
MAKNNSSAKDIIRKIYFYAVLLAGLMMMVIPGIDMTKIALETWVFPDVAQENYSYEKMPIRPFISDTKLKIIENDGEIKLTEDEKRMLDEWKIQHTVWQEKQENKNFAKINMQRSLVRDIPTMAAGIILFFSHGYILRKDKNKKV